MQEVDSMLLSGAASGGGTPTGAYATPAGAPQPDSLLGDVQGMLSVRNMSPTAAECQI